jgi:hypothetical protein
MPKMNMNDPYYKLRPEHPTPDDELCTCEKISDIYIAHKLGSNPIHCLNCDGEILPDKLAYDSHVAEEIASWNSVYGSLYRLWLDSGEYEQWARERLLDPGGQVTAQGLALAKRLGGIAKTYYYWFHDRDDILQQICPMCGKELTEKVKSRYLVCNSCLILKITA